MRPYAKHVENHEADAEVIAESATLKAQKWAEYTSTKSTTIRR
jgi:hypothetical protein